MSRPSIARAASTMSEASTSTHSNIDVKPSAMRGSSPPSDECLGDASSTPPTSVNPTPSIASDQMQSSPKRAAAAMDADEQTTESKRRKSFKADASTPAPQHATSLAGSDLKAAPKRASAKTPKTKPAVDEGGKVTVKGSKYMSLQSWLFQSQPPHPSTEAPAPSETLPVFDSSTITDLSAPVETLATDNDIKAEEEQIKSKAPKRKWKGWVELPEGDDSALERHTVEDSFRKAAEEAQLDQDGESSNKRAKRASAVARPSYNENKLSSAAAVSIGTVAAKAKKAVAAAGRSARKMAAKLSSKPVSKPVTVPFPDLPDADVDAVRAVRRSTRDANAAPTNEEKAATALQHDSRKMQNKQMLKRGKFSTGLSEEVMPLPNNWFIGKYGGHNDTYLAEKDLVSARGFRLGAEIFNPQPNSFVREGKDWAVTKGARNVFAGNAKAQWAKSDIAKLDPSLCQCKPSDPCGPDADCINRIMDYECNEHNCRLAECKNRPFSDLMRRLEKAEKVNNRQKEKERNDSEAEKRRPKYASVAMSFDQGVEVFEAPGKGFGMRAQRSFEPDQIIMEYFGEIIDQDEVDKRMATTYKDSTDFYMMAFHDGFILDATKGSMCRFVNHSCEPNCEIRKMLVSSGDGKKRTVEPRMALFAGSKGIQFNEELTYDYNFDPFSIRNAQKCLCGAANCRGILGPRPPKERGANSGSNGKEKAPSKPKTSVTKITAIARTKTGGVLTAADILKVAKRARF